MDIRPSIFAWTLTCSLVVSGVAFSQESRTKVILDADMVELFDDGTAMLLLERAPNIDLLGVTVVSGNTPMPAGVAAGVRQLEALGSEVPIYEGSRYGIRNWRGNKAAPEVLAAELQISPITGWGGYLRPDAGNEIDADPAAKWSDVYKHKYGEAPSYKRVYGLDIPDPDGNRDAVDFLVDTVNKYPGQTGSNRTAHKYRTRHSQGPELSVEGRRNRLYGRCILCPRKLVRIGGVQLVGRP